MCKSIVSKNKVRIERNAKEMNLRRPIAVVTATDSPWSQMLEGWVDDSSHDKHDDEHEEAAADSGEHDEHGDDDEHADHDDEEGDDHDEEEEGESSSVNRSNV